MLGDYGAGNGQISTWADGLSPVDAGGAGTEPSITVDEWHHIAFSYDGVNQYCLIDGNVVITAPTTGSVTVNPAWVDGLNIGSRYTDTSQFVEGYIDEVRLWNVYRTPAQIQANMNGSVAPQTGLVGYWNFDGNNANDLTTNAAHGTLQNGAAIVDAP